MDAVDMKARQGQSAKSTSSLSSKPLFLRLYLQSLQQNPVLTKAITRYVLCMQMRNAHCACMIFLCLYRPFTLLMVN